MLILDMRSGVKDATNLAFAEKELPAMLDDLCGVRVAEYDCLLDTQGIVRWGNDVYPCEKWCDILEVADAEILATYDSEFYAGTPAVSKSRLEMAPSIMSAPKCPPHLQIALCSSLRSNPRCTGFRRLRKEWKRLCGKRMGSSTCFAESYGYRTASVRAGHLGTAWRRIG